MHVIDQIAEVIDRELPVLTERERRSFFQQIRELLDDREEVDAEPDAFAIAKEHRIRIEP